MKQISCLVFVAVVACGSDGNSPTGPGDQSYNPPPEMTGSGTPSGATSYTCQQAADCGYWYCRCEDGAVVNSALCVNGYCMNAETACPRACEYFDHGKWTGEAGGGPGMTMTTCGGLGSQNAACETCMENECCSEASACGNSATCLDYWDCAVACNGDAGCRDECDALYPSGAAPYEALRDCLLDNCYSQCVGDV